MMELAGTGAKATNRQLVEAGTGRIPEVCAAIRVTMLRDWAVVQRRFPEEEAVWSSNAGWYLQGALF